MNDDDDYDPRDLPARRRGPGARSLRPKRATQDEGRLPLLKKAIDFVKGTEGYKRSQIRNQAKTRETEADYIKSERHRVEQQRKLAEEDTKLTRAQRESTVEQHDDEDAIGFELAKRRASREDHFDDREMYRDSKHTKHERKMNPKRGKGKYERLKDSYRNYQTYGSDGVHMKAWKEVYDEAVEKYGGEQNIPEDEYDNLMRGRDAALKSDNSQG